MARNKDKALSGGGKRPLIVFVHVPKTAGSTVNRVLKAAYRKGRDHCEAFIDDPVELARRLPALDWISGHVELDRLRRACTAASDRPLLFFSAVRDPISQVASHYNWLIEIHHRGQEFYEQHPERIKAISAHIRASDHSDPAAIIDNLKQFGGLFLNQQSRIVLGAGFDWSSGQLPKRLRLYDFVATESTLPALFERLTGKACDTEVRENSSPYHFDPAIFRAGPVRNFLLRNNYLDWMLYKSLSDRQLRAAISPAQDVRRKVPVSRLSA